MLSDSPVGIARDTRYMHKNMDVIEVNDNVKHERVSGNILVLFACRQGRCMIHARCLLHINKIY